MLLQPRSDRGLIYPGTSPGGEMPSRLLWTMARHLQSLMILAMVCFPPSHLASPPRPVRRTAMARLLETILPALIINLRRWSKFRSRRPAVWVQSNCGREIDMRGVKQNKGYASSNDAVLNVVLGGEVRTRGTPAHPVAVVPGLRGP